MQNQTLMQYFEWYLPHDGQHWTHLTEDAQHLANLASVMSGCHQLLRRPMKKDVGYGVYDLFDLGEFNQKGTVRTKYGSKKTIFKPFKPSKMQGFNQWPMSFSTIKLQLMA